MRTVVPALLLVALLQAPNLGMAADGDQRVVELNNVAALGAFFDLGQGAVRVVAIVTPTCPACAQLVAAVNDLFGAVSSKRLRGYVLLAPSGLSDTQLEGLRVVTELDDRRVIGFWDAGGVSRGHWAGADGAPARDGLYLYPTDARFSDVASTQALWSHTPGSAGDETIDAAALREQVEALLRQFEEAQRPQE